MQETITSALSSNLPSAALVLFWLAAMRYLSRSGWSLAIIGLIGTTLHEAAHYIVGLILGARPVQVSLWPKRSGNQWILGSVSFTRLNIWNSAFVAMAPLLLLGIAVLTLLFITGPALASSNFAVWGGSGYIIACCLSSCWPSSTDFKVGAISIFMYLVFGYIITVMM